MTSGVFNFELSGDDKQYVIGRIMGRFPVEIIEGVMHSLNWTWASSTSPDSVPTASEISRMSRKLLTYALDKYIADVALFGRSDDVSTATGGLSVSVWSGDGSVNVDLSFSITSSAFAIGEEDPLFSES